MEDLARTITDADLIPGNGNGERRFVVRKASVVIRVTPNGQFNRPGSGHRQIEFEIKSRPFLRQDGRGERLFNSR